jgi:hypothetical protein
MIYQRYRKDYSGEFLIYNVSLENGEYAEEREWVPNTIENNSHYGTAVIIGNGESRKSFNLIKIEKHRTGIGGVNRIQSYGCNALYRDFEPDFLIATNPEMVDEIIEKSTSEKTTILSNGVNLLTHPGKVHLIPYNVSFNAGAIAAYMACFDGHKRVYLMGFDNQPKENVNNNLYAGTECYGHKDIKVSSEKWENAMWQVFRAFPDVTFSRIESRYDTPKTWKSCLNYRQITFREFALEVDL